MPAPRHTFSRAEVLDIEYAHAAICRAIKSHRTRIRRPNSRGYHDLHKASIRLFEVVQFVKYGILPSPDARDV